MEVETGRHQKKKDSGKKSNMTVEKKSRVKKYDWLDYDMQIDTTKITGKGSSSGRKKLDDMFQDYNSANQFDEDAKSVAKVYEDKGEKAALKLLNDKFGDYDYEFVLNKETELMEDAFEYVGWSLKIIGDTYTYNTSNRDNFLGEQSFDIRDDI